MDQSFPELLTSLLKGVSRSFYLTMRVLPRPIRSQIGLAYLLARAADTIADTEIVPLNERLQALLLLRERILGRQEKRLDFGKLARHQGQPCGGALLGHCEDALRDIEYDKLTDPRLVRPEGSSAERILLERIEDILVALSHVSPADQQLIREVLTTITSGQELDLNRFGDVQANQIVSLKTELELDDYTYRVAGCVGEFWTRICRAHLFPKAPLDEALLLTNGVRFGKGLQLVNVLRDLPSDLRQGRCYLPDETLQVRQLVAKDLLQPDNEPQFRPLYQMYLDRTEDHLWAGWTYTNTLPRRLARVRLACAWPILIGIKTLAKLRAHNALDPTQRIKISRREVRGLMARSMLCYPWPSVWKHLFAWAGSR